MKKIRLFVINAPEPVNGITFWRMFRPLRHLHDNYDVEVIFNSGRITEADLYFSHVVLCFRPCNPDHPAALRRAKELGCKVIVDFDDDLLNVPIGYSFFKDLSNRAPFVIESIALADMVWLSTKNLKKVYEEAIQNFLAFHLRQSGGVLPPLFGTPKMTVIPNAVFPEDLPFAPNGNTRRAMWRGSDFHRDDLEAYKMQYDQILRNNNYFQWIGYAPTWGEMKTTKCKVDFQPGIMADQWFNYIKSLQLSLVWKPLANNIFNASKSNIAWLEATVSGAVCMCNLAGENPIWEHATKELPRLPESYEVIWRKSAEHIKQNYDLRAWTDMRHREILKLMSNVQQEKIIIPTHAAANGSN